MIEIIDYRCEWIREFASLAARLQAGLGPLDDRVGADIDHLRHAVVLAVDRRGQGDGLQRARRDVAADQAHDAGAVAAIEDARRGEAG